MLSNFMKSSKSKPKQKTPMSGIRSVGSSSSSVIDNNNSTQQNIQNIAFGSSTTLNNFDNTNNNLHNFEKSKSLPRSNYSNYNSSVNQNVISNRYSLDSKPSVKSRSSINSNYEENYYSCNYNQPISLSQSNSMISSKSSGSTIKHYTPNNSNYSLRSSTYNSGKTMKYNEMNQNNIPSSPVTKNDNYTHSKVTNTIITSHPLPSSSSTFNNMKGLNNIPPTPIRTVSNHHSHKTPKKTSKSSLEVSMTSPNTTNSTSNDYSKPSKLDDSLISLNTLELYNLYSNAAAYYNSTSSFDLDTSPKLTDNFRSLSRNFKMKEYKTNTNTNLSTTASRSNRSTSIDNILDNEESDLMSTVLSAGMNTESDSDDNEPLYNTYYRSRNKYKAPSISSNSTSNYTSISTNSQTSNRLYPNGYYASNSSLSTNLSNTSGTNKISSKHLSPNKTSGGINRRISRSQPNMALPTTSNATKAYASLLRNYKYTDSSNTTSDTLINTTPSINFTNIQELKPVSASPASKVITSRKDSNNMANNQRPQIPQSSNIYDTSLTPSLLDTQINIQPQTTSTNNNTNVNDTLGLSSQYQSISKSQLQTQNQIQTKTQNPNSNSNLNPNQTQLYSQSQTLQIPVIIGKRKQSIGCSKRFKEYKRGSNSSATSKSSSVCSYKSDNKNNISDHQQYIKKSDYVDNKDISSTSLDSKNTSHSKNEVSTSSIESIPISESKQPLQQQTKPLSPQLKLLRNISNSPILKNQQMISSPQLASQKPLPPSPLLSQKPLPSPLLNQKHQPLASPQLASQSPLQTYVTLDTFDNDTSSESNSLKFSTTLENNNKHIITHAKTYHSSTPSSPSFANVSNLNEKGITGNNHTNTNTNSNSVFSYMSNQGPSPITAYNSNLGNKSPLLSASARINSPKLLNNPFVKKDQELQQQQSFFNHLNHSSPNLTTPTVSVSSKVTSSSKMTSPKMTSPKITSPKMTSPKMSSPKITSPKITSPKMTSPKMTSPKLNSSRMGSPRLTTTRFSSSITSSPKIGYTTGETVNTNRNNYSNMPMNSFNYKSLARTPPITAVAAIVESPALSTSTQSTPKASNTLTVVIPDPQESTVQQNDVTNICTINERVSSLYNVDHQLQEQLQEQLQSGSYVKSNKYDDLYTLPSSFSSTSSNVPYYHTNNSNTSLNTPLSTNKVSPKVQPSLPSPTNLISSKLESTQPILSTSTSTSTSTQGHLSPKHQTASPTAINPSTTRPLSNNINQSQSPKLQQTQASPVIIPTQFNDNKNVKNYSTLDRSRHVRHKRNVSFNDEKKKVIENKINNNNNKLSPSINEIENVQSLNNEKLTTNTNTNTNSNTNNIENLSFHSNNSSYSGQEIINYNGAITTAVVNNNYNHGKFTTLGRTHDNKTSNKAIDLNKDDIDGKQFYVKSYRKLNNKELSYLQEVSYKQLKQSFPESSGFIKKDVLKGLQQKAKNKGSSPKWWSYWKKESKNSMSCSVFKTPLNTSILYASVSLDSVDEENPRRIPIIVYKCVQYLKKYGLKKEGLFRVNGNERRIKASVKTFDEPPYLGPDTFENLSVYDIAGLLKLYIRGLPDSLFPSEIYLPLLKYYSKYTNENDRIKILQLFLMMFPRNYLILLEYLFDLFNLITQYSEYNQMTSGNLAKIFAPNLIKPAPPSEPSLKDYEITSSIIQFMIDHDEDFHISRTDHILLKILQEVPEFGNKNHKIKKSNIRIPFMAINNIFSDSEETDDDRSSRYSGEYNKYSPQLANNNNSNNNAITKFSPNLSGDEKVNSSNNKVNLLSNIISNNLNIKINKKQVGKTVYNNVSLPLTPPQSPSSPTQSSSTFNTIKSQLNALSSSVTSSIISSVNPVDTNANDLTMSSNEEGKSFSNLSTRKKSTSFSIIRPNIEQVVNSNSNSNLNSDSNSTSKPTTTITTTTTTTATTTTTTTTTNNNNNIGISNSPTPVILNGENIVSTPLNPNSVSPIPSDDIIMRHESIHGVQRSNSKTIIRKNTVEENDNSSRSPSNDMSIERNNSSYSLNKLRQTASEI